MFCRAAFGPSRKISAWIIKPDEARPHGIQELLRIIHDNNPDSIADLEQMTGRKASNLSRTLRTMANYGLMRLEEGSQGRGRRAVKPVAVARSVNLTLDIGLGHASGRRHAESVVAQ